MPRVQFWLVLVSLLATLPGCSDGGKGGNRPIEVAFVSNNAEDFWTIAQRGTEKAAKDFDVKVDFRMPSDGSAQKQREIVEDLLTHGVKGLAVSANDAKNSVRFFKDVNSRVPLIMQDNDVPDPSARRCYIGTNNYVAGRGVGELIAKALPKGGKIAIFVGRMDAQNAIERRQGVLDYLNDPSGTQKEMKEVTPADASDLKLGDKYVLLTTKTDQNKAPECQNYARQLLLQHPDLGCLVGLWAYNPPALLLGARQAKMAGKVTIVGFDEDYETLKGVRTGEIYATVVQNPYEFGYQSVKILAGLARGDEKALTGRPDLSANNCIYIPHRVIDKDNVDEFEKNLRKLKGS